MPIEDFTEPHYVGEENTLFYIDCGIDVSSASEAIAYLKRPDGTKIKRAATVVTYNGSPSYARFRVERTDFNQAGDYEGQIYLKIGSWSGWGNPFQYPGPRSDQQLVVLLFEFKPVVVQQLFQLLLIFKLKRVVVVLVKQLFIVKLKEGIVDRITLDDLKMGHFCLFRYDRWEVTLPFSNFFSERIYKHQLGMGFTKEQALYTHVEILGGGPFSLKIAPPKSSAIDDFDVHYRGRYVRILTLNPEKYPEHEDRYRYKIAYFYARLANLAYDKRGILSFWFRFIKEDSRYYFCSEACCWSAQKQFPEFMDGMDPSKVVPALYLVSDDLVPYKEGVIL